MIKRELNNEKKELIQTYEGIKSTLNFMKINVSDYQPIDYGLQFTVSTNDWGKIIRIYQNKKGDIKIDYSQLGLDEHSIHIRELLEGKNKENRTKIEVGNLEQFDSIYPIIGTDESGKGDYFGPLVSAGVYVDEKVAIYLKALGVKDCKNLTDEQNIHLSKKIMDVCNGKFAIIEISPLKYNSIYKQLQRENKNLNSLLAWGHAKAIEEILTKVDCDTAIADQFADERFILSKLQEKGRSIRLIQRHKAEQNIAVAAASILARARFLEKLTKLSEQYRINFPKGSSITVIHVGKKFVQLHGENSLENVAKLHFKTTDDVLNKS